ncbi:MAG: hypothetical protein KIT16_14170 [Rhodospirillaceae bacterium]|nr:hypothetical protein [Rhodospirillaceae bacterium]
MQDELAKRRIAAALGVAPEDALVSRIAALCRRQVSAARPLLGRATAADERADHDAALRELARDG